MMDAFLSVVVRFHIYRWASSPSPKLPGSTMMRAISGFLLVVAGLVSCASPQSDKNAAAIAREQLAPTGKVRVAILVGPTASTFRATPDPATQRPRGVPVDLATALGDRFAVSVEQLPYS